MPLDLCEEKRSNQDDPCAWPYTLESNCTETFAEAAGLPYDIFNLLFGLVNVVCLLLIVKRLLEVMIDAKFVRWGWLKTTFGEQPRMKAHHLNSYDMSYVMLTLILSINVVLNTDLHAWRGNIPVRAYRAILSVAKIVGFMLPVVLVDHNIHVSFLMCAQVVTPDMATTMASKTFGHRLMVFFIALLAVCWVAALPGVFLSDPEGTEDNWIIGPPFYCACCVVFVTIIFGAKCTYQVWRYLENAKARDREVSYETATVLRSRTGTVPPARMRMLKAGVKRTIRVYVAAFVCSFLVLLYTATTAVADMRDRTINLCTPCGAGSLFDPPFSVLTLMGIFAVLWGPTRLSRAKRRAANGFSSEVSSGNERRNIGTVVQSISRRLSSSHLAEPTSVVPTMPPSTGRSGMSGSPWTTTIHRFFSSTPRAQQPEPMNRTSAVMTAWDDECPPPTMREMQPSGRSHRSHDSGVFSREVTIEEVKSMIPVRRAQEPEVRTVRLVVTPSRESLDARSLQEATGDVEAAFHPSPPADGDDETESDERG